MCGIVALVYCLLDGQVLDCWHGMELVCRHLWMALLVLLYIVDVDPPFACPLT